MAEIIQMPKLSDTMEEGVIATWLKKEGEFVEEGEALAEIETDKATMEYNSPEEGYLLKILLPAGKPCALNAPVAVLGEKGESFDESLFQESKNAPVSQPSPVEPVAAPKTLTQQTPVTSARIKASPLAKKLAKEKDLELSQIKGSGPNGRIVMRDIEQVEIEAPSVAPVVQGADYEDLPNSMMRKTIAKRLLAGKNEAPHFYLTISVDMSKLIAWRKELNSDTSQAKVSVNDLIVLATSRALLKHPQVNSSWHGDFTRRYHHADISMAVAIEDGLITPIIRQADKLGLREIASRSKELISAAKSSALKPEEYQGGSFSISNLGMMGIEQFTAIINPPQAAILAVGATVATPVVNENSEIVVQQQMKMTMSCDHRVVDGATGAEFLQTLKRYLEQPLSMLT